MIETKNFGRERARGVPEVLNRPNGRVMPTTRRIACIDRRRGAASVRRSGSRGSSARADGCTGGNEQKRTVVAPLFGLECLSRNAPPLDLFLFFVLSPGLAAPPGHAQIADSSSGGEHTAAERAAQETAREWLQHVDSGAWSRAWEEMAPALRDTVAQEQWKQRGVQARSPLGLARSRRLVRAQYRDSLSQKPDAGPFVRLRYRSMFGADLYVENVLAVQTDEAWRVAGYEVATMASRSERGTDSN